ncbi:phospho-sugar mutase [Ornithinimicrobium tianjinense]|uniref:Phosphomannomutase n=1 Tax=Ornithinimicrobium tianjinense TaxID=1195761 RepID=A0A917BP16_9MICO|nr:phospho-sugar mutase [Ornithinimicrobium tianjinense]GGF51326.1 phosphomannomutase [Ornithinimicrobium tianjinense]
MPSTSPFPHDAALPGGSDALLQEARAWVGDDPDPLTRDELTAVVDAAATGDETALTDLADRFSGFLEFGTAGLRGALGAGPNRMNRAVVIRTAAGLTAYLQNQLDAAGERRGPVVVVGFDARHNSDVFARDTAAVVVAAGGRAMVLPRPLPTPVLAFATTWLGADAGVMVTASHNPPQDNGYKVYLGDGSQIVPPADSDISAQIDRVRAASTVARADDGWETLGDEVLEAYLDAAVAVLDPSSSRDLSVVHTALHGVGSDVVLEAFGRAGFPAPEVVASQAEPDPAFPTVAFPNPEEAGAIDAALELAARVRPDLVIANDPDADRCAVAVQDGGVWRMLRGDEVGALLGQHVIERGRATGARRVLARSIVSSRLLGAMAAEAGLEGQETLTGFKWIGRVPGLAYGYEEALGYCVDPATVPDKDGVTAALLVAELAAGLKVEGRTLLDVLDDLAVRHGVHQTDAFSVRVSDLSLIPPVMARLRGEPPAELGGVAVTSAEDLAEGAQGLPPTEGMRYLLADQTRVIVRPSGTEPKLKVYLEAVVPVQGGVEGLGDARQEAKARLAAVRSAMEELTAL